MSTLAFISDIHLDHQHPESQCNQLFLQLPKFCQHHHVSDLFILGDLFDSWIGDEECADYPTIITCLQTLARLTQLHFMRGNHDFMIGQEWFRATGTHELPDPFILHWQKKNILLTHGDAYCVNDPSYLKLRKRLQHPWTIATLRNLPLAWRYGIRNRLQRSSQQAKVHKTKNRMMVPITTIREQMAHHQCQALIHGHTHQPGIHHLAEPETGAYQQAYILPAWEVTPAVLLWPEHDPAPKWVSIP